MAYTGRLGHRDARPANFELGVAFQPAVLPPPGTLPAIDLPTLLTAHHHASTLAVKANRTLAAAHTHRSTATLD